MISACMTVSVRELRTAVREWACWNALRMQTNGCESSANKASWLQLFLHFLENALGMDANSLPTVESTCKCLRMAYEHYECLSNKPVHEISNNVVCATSKASDQLAHMHSLIRTFA